MFHPNIAKSFDFQHSNPFFQADVDFKKGMKGRLKVQFDSNYNQERILREVRDIYANEGRVSSVRRKKLEKLLGVVNKWKSWRQRENNLKFSNIVEVINMKNWDVLEKIYGGNSEGDRQMISDIKSEIKNVL